MASINASTSGAGGIIQTADASGVLALQSGGVAGLTINANQKTIIAPTTLATPSAGMVEFNNTIFTGAPTATTRGIIPTEQFFRLDSALAGANATGAQNVFGVGVTLAGSTVYEFEIIFSLNKTAGTTNHTLSSLFGGTATLNAITYTGIANFFNGAAIPNQYSDNKTTYISTFNAATANGIFTAASAQMAFNLVIKGTVSINAGGTFTPQYTLSAAPGGAYSTLAGSYMKIKPIGVSGANTSVGTWA
jgi:hypothetical protein